MVYCGKPSRGCQMCRTRRIKCDETKPTCLQCQKSRRQCPGYKDDFDLVFRNETQATERRARRAVNKKGPTQIILHDDQSAFSTGSGDGDQYMTNSDTALSILFAPSEAFSVPLEQQAPCFFLSNYVLSPSNGTRGYFEFLAPMIRTEPPDSQLSIAFSAVAMASLANRPNSRGRGLMPQAVAQYTKALKATNLALQNPAQQKSDQTLAAILMLTFFETLASERTNAGAWYSHVDGAVQLVKMRGKKQLRTKVGQALFQVVRQQMVKLIQQDYYFGHLTKEEQTVNCMTSSKAPILGADWWCADSPKEDYGVFITRLNITVAELRSEINIALNSYPRTPEYFQKVLDLMRRAQAMEKDYLQWEETLPDYWQPKTVAWVDNTGGDITKAEVCPGKVDVYQDIWYATIWNHARIVRLYISGAIVRCAAWICSPVDYRTTPEYATATRLCVDLVTDVIASIPLHLGWRIEQGGGFNAGDLAGFPRDVFATPNGIGALFAMWPLFSISNTDYITDSQRAWVKGRLVFISETMGLNHAKVLATFQLRLPSMIIRRDNMGHSPPTPQMISAAVARGVYAPRSTTTSPINPTTTTLPIRNQNNTASPQGQSQPLYTLNPLQQREAMQREAYEKERASLLKKSSNGQGDSVERLMANYLAV